MTDWNRSGLWHSGASLKVYGQKDEEENLFPLVGQYFDMAACCCSPYVILVVACPPDSVSTTATVKADNREFSTWVDGGVLFYSDVDAGTTDDAWEIVTAIIDPDTNTENSGKWAVRRIGNLTDRAWRLTWNFPADVMPVTQTTYCAIGPAFIDSGKWVFRGAPEWLQDEPITSSGYFRDNSTVSIPSGGGDATTKTLYAYRGSGYYEGSFFHTSP